MDDTQAETPAETTASSGNNSNIVKIVVVVIVIAVLAYLAWEFGIKKSMTGGDSMQVSPSPSESGSMEASPDVMTGSYKDGVYTASGQYQNPAGTEEVEVSLTIADGKVSSATLVGTPDNPTTTTMQNKFKQGFTTEVVGKSVDEINLTVVNGSSLTPKGFMDALEKIKTQAKA